MKTEHGLVWFTNEEIAQTIHGLVRGLACACGDPMPPEWWDLPCDAQEMYMESVGLVKSGLPAAEIHEHWRAHLVRSHGWRWAPIRDYDGKGHPMLRPYEDLEPVDRVRMKVIGMVVTVMVAQC